VLARAKTLADAGRVDEAVEEICAIEKKSRVACDGSSCSKLLCSLTKLYFDAGNWAMLREYLVVMSKKRGQLKRAITDMVHQAMGWLETLEQAKKLELIDTLNEITEGKIFLEVEKARLTKMQADMKEAGGDIAEAANLIQEVQVETFTAMDRTEKTEYILNQMRLVLLKKDYIRCQIISKKLNPKLLDADDFQDLKIRYFQFMVEYWLHEGKHLDVAKSYSAIMNTKKVRDSEADMRSALTAHTAYLCMAMFDNEQEDMLNRIDTMEKKALEKVPNFQRLVKMFLRLELIAWPLPFEAELKAHEVFSDKPHEGGEERWKLLKKRVVQHNIKVISTYYDHIHSARLAELIGLDPKETELEVSELVCSKFIFAKINRPAGIVKFGQKEDYSARLNDWSGSISKMLDLVENTCHLIQKEQMVHAARAKIKAKK
jgi:26S proteasome regulatory subunit N5